jgi:hypothetical protein
VNKKYIPSVHSQMDLIQLPKGQLMAWCILGSGGLHLSDVNTNRYYSHTSLNKFTVTQQIPLTHENVQCGYHNILN